MKKKILSAILVVFALYTTGYAQTTKPQAPVKTGNEWKMPSDVFQRAKTYSAGMQKKLGLDSLQTKKVYDIFLANTKPLDEISVAPVTDKEKETMRKTKLAAFDEKLKSIFSSSQYQKYISMERGMK